MPSFREGGLNTSDKPIRPIAVKITLVCFLGVVLLGYGLQVYRFLISDQMIMDFAFLEVKARHNDERNIPGLPDWIRDRKPMPADAEIRERLETQRPSILQNVRTSTRTQAAKASAILLIPTVLLGLLLANLRIAWILSVIGSLLGSLAFGLQISGSAKLVERIPHLDTRIQLLNALLLTFMMVVALIALLAPSTRNYYKSRQ